MAVNGPEGLANAKRAVANQSFAAQVVFQENSDGRRRTVINLYQAQVPAQAKAGSDKAEPRLLQLFGVIIPDGKLISAVR